jgi:hypothetical protein
LTKEPPKLLQSIGGKSLKLLLVATLHRIFEVTHNFKPPVSQTNLDHPSIKRTSLSKHVLKSLKAIE